MSTLPLLPKVQDETLTPDSAARQSNQSPIDQSAQPPRATTNELDVAIVNHNTREHLRACLQSVVAERPRAVVVVDNASTDGSPAMVGQEFPWVKLLANPGNPGYGAGANQALAACRAPFVLLLNSDTRLMPGALAALGGYLRRHPRAGLAGPRLVYLDGRPQPSIYSFPTPLNVLLEETTVFRAIRRVPGLREWFPRTATQTDDGPADWVLGAALAIRRKAFEQVGGFDASFFLYAEEIDLSYRLAQAGWETHFTPAATVIHAGGASSGQRRADLAVQYYESLLHFYGRHYSNRRRHQLTWIMKSIVLARWLRDAARLRLARERQQRAGVVENLAAWARILRHPGLQESLGR